MESYKNRDSSKKKEMKEYVADNINDVTVDGIAERFSLTLSDASYLIDKVRREKKSSFDFSR